jgi:hypothetical protein
MPQTRSVGAAASAPFRLPTNQGRRASSTISIPELDVGHSKEKGILNISSLMASMAAFATGGIDSSSKTHGLVPGSVYETGVTPPSTLKRPRSQAGGFIIVTTALFVEAVFFTHKIPKLHAPPFCFQRRRLSLERLRQTRPRV